MKHTAQANSRQITYAAGCRAGMDPPEPFAVPSIYAEWAEEWERGYRDTCTATGIHHFPQKARSAPKAPTPELTSLEEVIPAKPAFHPKPKKTELKAMSAILDQQLCKELAL